MIDPVWVGAASQRTEGDKRIAVYELARGEGIGLHRHDYAHDLLIVEGSVRVWIAGRESDRVAGERVTFPASAPHAVLAHEPSVVHSIVLEADAQRDGV